MYKMISICVMTLLMMQGAIAQSTAIRFAESEIKRAPQAWQLDHGKRLYYGYAQGVGTLAMLKVWRETDDRKYLDYVIEWADTLINDRGEIHLYRVEAYNIDYINSGKVLFEVYRQTGDEKYRLAMDRLVGQMKMHPHTQEGVFWHKLIGMIRGLAGTLPRYQDASGLWYQVPDQGDREGNYPEASVSSMFMYSFAKAVNKGYIDKQYRAVAEKAYEGLMNRLIVENEDGTLTLTRCCSVGGLGGSPYRDGSFEYYISEKIRDNDAKATGPFIMGCLELNK